MKNTLLYILLFVINFNCFGQEYLLDLQKISPEDGLANMHTYATFKDSKGFLWIGTKYGLNRYDGYEFKLFTHEQNGLFRNDLIQRIEEDSEGNLWLFYMQSGSAYVLATIEIFNPISGKVTPLKEYISSELPFDFQDILFPRVSKKHNHIWINDSKGQLFLYEDRNFKRLFNNPGKEIRTVAEVENGVLIASGNELIHLDYSGQILKKDRLPNPVHLISTTDTSLWVVTGEKRDSTFGYTITNTIWRKEQGDSDFEIFTLGSDDELRKRNGGYVHRGQNGFWYLNSMRYGETIARVSVFDPLGNELFDSRTDLIFNSNNLCETTDNIWLAGGEGVLKLNVSKNPFQIIHTRKKLSDTRGITEDEFGNIYFLNGQMFQYIPSTNKVRKLTLNSGAYNLIYLDSLLHAGMHSQAVSGINYNMKTGEEKRLPTWKGYTPSFTSIETENPKVHLFGNVKGLSYFDFRTYKGRPFQEYNEFEELENYAVYHLYENESGIWLATEIGIYLLKEGKGIVRHFSKSTGDLPFNNIRHISEGSEGVFWLATSGGGIIQWKPNFDINQNPEARQFTTADGLSNNYTYAVYPDDYGNLWIPSDLGLMQMDASNFRVKTFLTKDGLPHNEFNISSHYKAKDGTFYFGGLGGLISFHPKVFAKKKSFEAPLKFTEFHLWEDGEEKMTNKTESLQSEQSITIHPSDKLFELKYALLDFDKTENHNYSYKIEGYDERPQIIKENFLRITNLPYGDYQLKIEGQNITKGWSGEKLSIPIHVLKPFYLQWWFIVALIIMAIGSIVAFIFRRERLLRKESERLEVEVEKRTRTIQKQSEELKELDKAKTRFFSNITHEFRTPLTLILGPSEQLAQSTKIPIPERKKLWNISKNAQQLLLLVNQMLDISKIEGRQMRVEVSKGEIVSFVRGLTEQFELIAKKKQQELKFICSENIWQTAFDKNKLNKIIYNLLSNAMKFTGEGGTVNVFLGKTIHEGESAISIKVEDSGIGISTEEINRIFDRFYQTDGTSTRSEEGTGIGLSLVKELVELMGGEITASSEVGEGTCFAILLPVLKINQSETNVVEQPIVPVLDSGSFGGTPVHESASKISTTKNEKLDVLIIEDNVGIHEYIRSCIDPDKYNIITAFDGEEGIQKAFDLIPDLIISDVMMPKKDGFYVTTAIRENIVTSHIPLILLTAKSSLESRLQGLKRGADAYLTKPFSPRELVLRIDKLIELRQILRNRYRDGVMVKTNQAFKKEDVFVAKVRAYIFENIEETNLNGDIIGKHFGITRMHLYRKLKALTGKTISEVIKDIRLKKAMELLADKSSNLNITEVSYRTGFSSISYFSRAFKDVYGKSPSEI